MGFVVEEGGGGVLTGRKSGALEGGIPTSKAIAVVGERIVVDQCVRSGTEAGSRRDIQRQVGIETQIAVHGGQVVTAAGANDVGLIEVVIQPRSAGECQGVLEGQLGAALGVVAGGGVGFALGARNPPLAMVVAPPMDPPPPTAPVALTVTVPVPVLEPLALLASRVPPLTVVPPK